MTRCSKRFAETFRIICEHYGCTPEEIALMKQAAREDMAGAERSFEKMRRDIEGPAVGVNDRILASLPAKQQEAA